MEKAYERIDWQNEPSSATPIDEDNLNIMDSALDVIDDRVVAHDSEITALQRYETRAAEYAARAESSAAAAAISETNASASESSATSSASSASTSASNASASASRASTSESNAQQYMNDAHGWADNKGDSGSSNYSATNNAYYYSRQASSSASSASSSASSASTSAQNAAASASSASTSASNASASESSASTSAGNARTSEQNALASANRAASYAKDFVGATASTDGEDGYVPAPSAGDQNKYLRGDGTWGNSTLPTINANEVVYSNTASGLSATNVQSAIDEVASEGFMSRGAKLGVDANDLWQEGQYWVDRTSSITADNFPTNSRYGFLTVFNSSTTQTSSNPGVVTQEWQAYSTKYVFRRNRINNSWTDWWLAYVKQDGVIATTEFTSIASRAYTIGAYLIMDGVLRKVTSAIASGDTINSSNTESVTVGSEINQSLSKNETSISSAAAWMVYENNKSDVRKYFVVSTNAEDKWTYRDRGTTGRGNTDKVVVFVAAGARFSDYGFVICAIGTSSEAVNWANPTSYGDATISSYKTKRGNTLYLARNQGSWQGDVNMTLYGSATIDGNTYELIPVAMPRSSSSYTNADENAIFRVAEDILVYDMAYTHLKQNNGIDSIVSRTAGAHNSIYRGKYLGNSVTNAQWAAIADGTFSDLFIGDYWTIGGINYRIAHFDYWLYCGDIECTTHHAVIVPDVNLYEANMNDGHVTTGAYIGSKMYTTNLAQAKTTIRSAFGSNHILTHRESFANSVANGRQNAGAWYDSDIDLMNEHMVYGGKFLEATSDGGANVPYVYSTSKSQLKLFAERPDLIIHRVTNRANWWLRDVVSGTSFAIVTYGGLAYSNAAANSHGVRPAFAIC